MKTNPNEPIAALTTDQWQFLTNYGLTKREYFAAMAMQGLLANGESFNWFCRTEDKVQEAAVSCADALIAELNKEQK